MTAARAHVLAFVALAALVGAALALRFVHLPRAITVVGLGALAVACFAGVIAFQMNLRSESRAVKLIFLLPLVLPLFFAVAVVADAIHPGVRP
jgi:hypothetical protein